MREFQYASYPPSARPMSFSFGMSGSRRKLLSRRSLRFFTTHRIQRRVSDPDPWAAAVRRGGLAGSGRASPFSLRFCDILPLWLEETRDAPECMRNSLRARRRSERAFKRDGGVLNRKALANIRRLPRSERLPCLQFFGYTARRSWSARNMFGTVSR